MSVILGINAFHPDSSACLLVDGCLVGAVAEERLGDRNKHTSAFPVNAVKWLLDDNNINLSDISHIAVSRNKSSNLFNKFSYGFKNFMDTRFLIKNYLNRNAHTRNIKANLALLLGCPGGLSRCQVYPVEHHVAHIASSFYVSPFESVTAGFSYDGSGDFVSCMTALCEGSKITVKDRVFVPNSLGHFYTAMCQFIGFENFGEEYKVMGLAPYGENKYAELLDKMVKSDASLGFELTKKYFRISNGMAEATFRDGQPLRLGAMYSSYLEELLGPARRPGAAITVRDMDIAKSTQEKFEKITINALTTLNSKVPIKKLAMAGGCALNGVMNARIYRDLPVDQMYIQPAASDDGTAIGAAFHCWHSHLGHSDRFQMDHAYWGPEYSDSQIRKSFEAFGLVPHQFKTPEIAAISAAKLIAEGSVIGWHQGRSEWGPRALGNRSILANPAHKDMKLILNRKIKKREDFRPFAPSVLVEDVPIYFEQTVESPFMMHVIKFHSKWRKTFPAVVHVDGTGRIQTVSRDNNALYYHLIQEVKKLTGHGIVLNTSFNENEPIVDTPEQAISCFMRTDMDAVFIGRYMLKKHDIKI